MEYDGIDRTRALPLDHPVIYGPIDLSRTVEDWIWGLGKDSARVLHGIQLLTRARNRLVEFGAVQIDWDRARECEYALWPLVNQIDLYLAGQLPPEKDG